MNAEDVRGRDRKTDTHRERETDRLTATVALTCGRLHGPKESEFGDSVIIGYIT